MRCRAAEQDIERITSSRYRDIDDQLAYSESVDGGHIMVEGWILTKAGRIRVYSNQRPTQDCVHLLPKAQGEAIALKGVYPVSDPS